MISTAPDTAHLLYRFLSFSGVFVFIAIAFLLSKDRKNINWKTVYWGVGLQFLFGIIVLHPSMQEFLFAAVNGGVNQLLSFSDEAAKFVFGSMEAHVVSEVDLATGKVTEKTIIGEVAPGMNNVAFAIILPTIIFFSSLMSIMYHLGIMQRLVWGIAWLMQRTMQTSGPESLSAAANIFVGQTEAPLVVKPYIDRMHGSELHAIMTGGFATVAGGVMAAYVGFLAVTIPTIAGHLVAASIMSAPAALAISKIMYPMPTDSEQVEEIELNVKSPYRNLIEAAASGATEGMKLVLNVLAMLVAFVGLIALINFTLGIVSIGDEALSLQMILGWLFAPLAFCMGVPWSEAGLVGTLLGEKLVLTEFIAYLHLGEIMNGTPGALSERSAVIASYALCGFANFASIGIQIGGIGGIAPDRTSELAAMGLRAMIGGTLAAFMTATIAGVLL
jgi:concentrative nucleoside transporter, CNT family